MPENIIHCRICRNSRLEHIIGLGDQALTGVFPKSPHEPILTGPLDLVRCVPDGDHSCGLLQLAQSYPLTSMYGDSYGYRSGLNSSMVDHLTSKVEGLKQLVSLEKK